MWRKRDIQEVTAKERDFIGASARLAPFSSLLNQRLCDEVFQREAASQDLIDAYLNHISRKSRLPLFPDVSFLLPSPPRRCNPSVLVPSSPSPTIPLSLRSSFALPPYFFFLPYFSSFLLRSRLPFLIPDPSGRGRREQFARIRTKKLVPPVAVLALLLVSRSRFRRIRLSLVSTSSRVEFDPRR